MVSTPLSPLTARPETIIADDFKQIKGIGPAVERRLHDAGIFTFAQLAALAPLDIATLVSHMADLSAERIVQQDWVGRARLLASNPTEPSPNSITDGDQQRYATFSVELLLDDAVEVRRTRIKYIQDGAEDAWAGWEEARLMNFVARYAPLRPQPPTPISEPATPAPQPVIPVPQPAASANLSGKLGLRTLAAAPIGGDGSRNFLYQDQPFNVDLVLDLTEVDLSRGDSLDYRATIYAKRLSGGLRQTIAEASGAAATNDTLTIKTIGTALPVGLYRLEVAVALTLLPIKSDLSVFLEGSLLQIF
ncbi:MAG: hypothetical protein HYR94_21445 [Chloroflexi bacterium]|nr:hypothetical protein [Chloroflexota bacterium]